jgi:hypothetical protein
MTTNRHSFEFVLMTHARAPDCSSVRENELSRFIFARLPSVDGVIPYSFSSPGSSWASFLRPSEFYFYRFQALAEYPEANVDAELKEGLRSRVRFVLEQFEKLTNFTLKFVEQENPETGIYFRFVSKADFANNAIGEAKALKNIRGKYKRSYVTLLAEFSKDIYKTTESMHTISHEIMHSLGFNHLHDDNNIVNKLRQTRNGIFCSVLPYTFYINTEVSECKNFCTNLRAMPGPLDLQMIDMVYRHGIDIPLRTNIYDDNSFGMIFTLSAFVSYAVTHTAFEWILYPKIDISFKNKKLLADSGFVALAYMAEADTAACEIFSIAMLIKFLLTDSLRKNSFNHGFNTGFDYSAVILFSFVSMFAEFESDYVAARVTCMFMMALFLCSVIGIKREVNFLRAKLKFDVDQVSVEKDEESLLEVVSEAESELDVGKKKNSGGFYNGIRQAFFSRNKIGGEQSADEEEKLLAPQFTSIA